MTEPEERLAPSTRGEAALRKALHGGQPRVVAGGHEAVEAEEEFEDRSLLEDLQALYEDGKTYAAAELTFQKTRASFAGDKIKSVAVFGVGAALAGLLALIGLTVGMIITLTPLIGPFGATLLVVGVLLIAAFLCARRAGQAWGKIMSAFGSGAENRP